jgi:hypothetical protein
MNPDDLMELLLVAANTKTKEEKARILWRASDYMWREYPRYPLRLCREFNDLCQDLELPWVKDLWSTEERKEVLKKHGITNES